MKQKEQNMTERTVYFDYLRVLATFAVIVLHLSAQNWYTTDVNGFTWQTLNFYNSLVRWGVPVFVMISGALFLGRDIPLKKIYAKYILRIAVAYIVWSAIYALFTTGSLFDRVEAFVFGHYHMWFMLMIIGLYACIPFVKPIVDNHRKTEYFLLLAFIFAFVIPEFQTLGNDLGNGIVIKGINVVHVVREYASDMGMQTVLGYASYFVLGYYMHHKVLSQKQRIAIYIAGLFGFVFTIGMDLFVALKNQAYCSNYYGNFTVNVSLEALAVFTWLKYRKYENRRLNTFVQRLSKYSFGGYLVHTLVMEQLNTQLGLNTLSFCPALSVLCIGVLVSVVSFAVSALLNHIPFVNKYIV